MLCCSLLLLELASSGMHEARPHVTFCSHQRDRIWVSMVMGSHPSFAAYLSDR